ncbi:MAG: C4-dicarboxylate ABC transporter, partial [Actinobacteria bacterium]|nr:C4-dicarboxylate ABC transporter [Actinomycetota bacterium]
MPPQQSWISRWFGVLGSPIEGKVLIGPNWFASVMGTAIVASAGATLPVAVPQFITTAAWAISVVLLLALLVFMPLNWVQHPDNLRNLADDPIAIQFFGAPPMALMAVAAATLLVGQQYIGEGLAVGIAWVLWSVGTALGFVTAVAVPFRLFTALEVRHDGAFGGWLMPVVPPMVSAAVGALLVPHTPAGEARETMLLGCYALFGMSLMASLVIITLIWSRLAHFGTSGSARVPTLWMVLGPV